MDGSWVRATDKLKNHLTSPAHLIYYIKINVFNRDGVKKVFQIKYLVENVFIPNYVNIEKLTLNSNLITHNSANIEE